MSNQRAASDHARARLAICVFAKPPRPGAVKTRLVPPLSPSDAASLARAFIIDTWQTIDRLPWARAILATTEHDAAFAIDPQQIWLQGDGDLGTRLEHVLSLALTAHRAAIAIGADSPGIPPDLLEAARAALAHHDAVIGPARDGGFYLIGLSRCPHGLLALADIPWSTPATCERTLAALRARGLRTAILPTWFDVDEQADLLLLRSLLEAGEIVAPATAAVLASLREVCAR